MTQPTDIIKTSASAIESFDDTTPFGCERRWYFKHVQRLPEPPRDNLTLGTNLHKAVENFLIKGSPDEMSSEVQRLFHAIKPEVIRVREEGFLALEHPLDFMLAPDVRIIGRIDVLRKNGPLDWKTSSDLKYAPTPWKLSRSTQMLVYSAWQAGEATFGTPTQVTHVYVQTKGKPLTQRVDAPMNNSLLTEGISRVINIARRMKEAAKLPVADELKPDRSKCKAGTKLECPFLAVCPVEKSTMSLAIQRLQARLNPSAQHASHHDNTAKPSEPAPTPMAPAAFLGERSSDRAAEAALDAVKANMARVVPPDAPKKTFERKLEIQQPTEAPEPSLAAQVAQAVVEHAAPPAEPPKRGPGRPPGAKNKPKAAVPAAETLPAGATGTGGIEAVAKAPAAEHYTFKTVTVSMTGKLNMGYYQSLDVHVSQTMEYSGSPDEAFSRCAAVVKSQLDSALTTMAGRKVEDAVPADVLASTKR